MCCNGTSETGLCVLSFMSSIQGITPIVRGRRTLRRALSISKIVDKALPFYNTKQDY